MKRFPELFRTGLGLLAILAAFSAAGCGDDPVDPGPPEPEGFSRITFLHANPAYTNEVFFYRGDTTSLNFSLTYGNFANREVPNGSSVKYTIKGADGTTLTTGSSRFDSASREMLVFTGDANTRELFVASAPALDGISSTNAAVRFIHAEKDAQPKQILVNDTNGLVLSAATVAYKNGSEFAQVPTSSTTRFWVVDPEKKTAAIEVPASNLNPGGYYTIVLHGAKEAPVNKPVASLIAEP